MAWSVGLLARRLAPKEPAAREEEAEAACRTSASWMLSRVLNGDLPIMPCQARPQAQLTDNPHVLIAKKPIIWTEKALKGICHSGMSQVSGNFKHHLLHCKMYIIFQILGLEFYSAKTKASWPPLAQMC